eukprot:CAMPEP_0206269610 /NCGR_PEP_ID=MMETSP0047_2-20121206/32398_1 /ASSEMBLY_ACC=CAM_ASM_000192 /TAXON_ID=195065 /ORGANISM="Chroomonas mesostigmatica_cf, Strain CCMP1168" /LENGTH=116 /DNA_ID=CAMNT_0053698139 /DNA_START=69 /DNA_END=419 /DNA_ORIENTATION=-
MVRNSTACGVVLPSTSTPLCLSTLPSSAPLYTFAPSAPFTKSQYVFPVLDAACTSSPRPSARRSSSPDQASPDLCTMAAVRRTGTTAAGKDQGLVAMIRGCGAILPRADPPCAESW